MSTTKYDLFKISQQYFLVNANEIVTAEGQGITCVNASYKTYRQTFSPEHIVLVGKHIHLSYDTKYYAYDIGIFYSTSSSVSDSMDLYLLVGYDISPGLNIWIDLAEYPDYFKDIKPIILTTQISGSGFYSVYISKHLYCNL